MKLLDEYFKIQQQIYDYFGYVEDWKVIPIEDAREYYWILNGEGSGGTVGFAKNEDNLKLKMGQYYENTIYTQRFLPKWVYRGEDFTMICVDTHVDGNKFLQIFDNSKEVPERTEKKEIETFSTCPDCNGGVRYFCGEPDWCETCGGSRVVDQATLGKPKARNNPQQEGV